MKKPITLTAPRTATASIAEAVASERARISAILEHPEAKGRSDMAQRLALYSDMAPAQAIDLLRSSAKSESPFEAVMQALGPSGVPTTYDPSAAHGGDSKAARLAEIKANAAAFNASRRGGR